MTDEIYVHLPKWRRVIRDLAKEAGIKRFLNETSEKASKSTEPSDSSITESQVDHDESGR